MSNKHTNNAELFEDGMHHVMMMGNEDEACRVLLHNGDHHLGRTIFMDVARPVTFEDEEDDKHAIQTGDPKVIFIVRWIRISYNILFIFLQKRELKAILKAQGGLSCVLLSG